VLENCIKLILNTNYIKLKKGFAIPKEQTYLSNNLAYFERPWLIPQPI
jgi:hypothetical protein